VQLIEDTVFGVRSSVMTLEKRGSRTRFILVPMLHLASPEFFQVVQERLAECDVIVAEGVPGMRARIITLSYRIGGRFHRGGLVLQQDALELSSLRAEIVRPDLSAADFAIGWRAIRWPLRVLLYVAIPLAGIWLAIVGPQRALPKRLTVDDQVSLEESEAMEGGLGEALIDARDRALCAELVRLANDDVAGERTVGVCWGAMHMRAVVAALHGDLGYRITNAEWITAF
jgi:hypothetical protein